MNARALAAEARRFTLHVLTGFAAVAAHYGTMAAMIAAGLAPVGASSVGFVAGALVRFALAYRHVFDPTLPVVHSGLRFAVALGAQALANAALLSAGLAAGIPTWPAQVGVTVLMTFANYAAYRLWVFR
ncbi:MAG: GtrA family protein [Burkholderiales bacterium]|nr:GtrA family protein [Burkholderiales bacterium]